MGYIAGILGYFLQGKSKGAWVSPQVVAVIGIFWLHDHVKRDD